MKKYAGHLTAIRSYELGLENRPGTGSDAISSKHPMTDFIYKNSLRLAVLAFAILELIAVFKSESFKHKNVYLHYYTAHDFGRANAATQANQSP